MFTTIAPSRRNRILSLTQGLDLSIFVLGLLVLIEVVFLIWTFDKGLDLTDEGFYLLSATHPEDVLISFSSFHWLTYPIFKLVRGDIFSFRLVNLILLLLSVTVFWFGILGSLKQIMIYRLTFHDSIAMYLFLVIGGLATYSWTLRTPSYNSLSVIGTYITLGLFFSTLLVAENDKYKKYCVDLTSAIGTGISISLIFFSKSTTAITITAIIVFITMLWKLLSIHRRLLILLGLGLGITLGLVFYFEFLQPMDSWLTMIRSWIYFMLAVDPAHSSHILVKELVVGLMYTSYEAFISYFMVYILVGVTITKFYYFDKSNTPLRQRRLLHSFLFCFLVFAVSSLVRKFPFHEVCAWGVFYVGWLVLIVSMILGIALTIPSQMQLLRFMVRRELFLIIGFLIIAPFAVAAGTSNRIFCNVMNSMASWYGIIFVLLLALSKTLGNKLLLTSGLLLIAVFQVCNVIWAHLYEPYRLNKGMLEQVVETEIAGSSTTLKLDLETSQILKEIQKEAEACGYLRGDYLLAFWDLPGVVFALGARSPLLPWWTPRVLGLESPGIMKFLSKEELGKSIILHTVDSADAAVQMGLDCHDSYELCAKIRIPRGYSLSGKPLKDHENLWLWFPRKRAK